jgi:hypothetical protein
MKMILAAVLMLAATTTFAEETVFVKYHGPVDLSPFQCENTQSSFVHRICYWPEKSYLVVLLNSTYYHYCRLPQSTYDAWLVAPSKGRFYNAAVKGNYDCRLGGIPINK